MDIEFKNKGVRGCIGSACSLLSNNKRLIFRKTYPAALLGAFFAAVLTYLLLPNPDAIRQAAAHPLLLPVLTLACLAAFAMAETGFIGRLSGCITGDYKQACKRSFIFPVIVFGLFLAVYGVNQLLTPAFSPLAKSHPILTLSLLELFKTLLLILLIVFLLPLVYSATKYLFVPEARASQVFTAYYKEGFHHKGFILLTLFVLLLIMIPTWIVLLMPGFILALEQVTNTQGQLIGDPDGLPSCFGCLLVAVLTVLFFLAQYVLSLFFYSTYFIYLSIKNRIDEKAKNTIYRP